MILVTGATGHVGAELVTQLAAAGHKVRAMTRRPETLTPRPEVEVVRGDAADPATLAAAFAGATRAFLMSAEAAGTAERPSQVPHLVEAAVGAGVEYAVLLSVYSGGSGGDVIADWCRQIEDSVTGSGMAWTLLRPGRFMSNALQWAPQIRRGDEVQVPFASRPAASIDPADIAAIAAAALTSTDHRDAAYQLSGPQVLTPVDEVAVLAALLDRPLHVVDPPLEQVRAGMARGGFPPAVLDAIINRTRDTDEGTEVLPTVAELLGRSPGTFSRWATRHLDHFTT
ncbi:MAG: NAD(P)H-binding protein [Pseudonocardiaceae bacterium]